MNTHQPPYVPNSLNRGALRIAGLYLLIGGLWILFSDRLAARIAASQEMLTTISLYKGWGYVVVTALLLYWLIRHHTAALHASEAQLQRVIDAMPAFIAYVGADRHYRFTNQTYQEWYEDETAGKHVEEVLGEAAYRTVSKYIDKVLAGETVRYETEIPYQDTELFMAVQYIPDSAADGQVKGFFVMAQDRTEQKQAEEEHRLWANAFEGCAHGIAIGDPDTNRILVCNPAFASMHKCRVEDIEGSGILSLYAPSEHEHVRRNIEKADQIGHSSYETSMIRGDGSIFPVQMDVVSVLGEDGELLHRVTTAQDISERKAVDEKLKASETKYRTLVEHLPAITYIADPDQYIGVTYISPQIESLGFDAKVWLADPEYWFRQIHPEDQGRVLAKLQQFQASDASFRAEYRLRLPNGETRWFHDESIRVRDQAGKPILQQGFMLDITERKQAEENLRRFQLLSEHSRDIILFMGRTDGRILEANAAALQAYGYTHDELLALTIRDLRASDTHNLTADQMAQADAGGILFETIHRRRDGTTFPVEVSSQGATIGEVRTLISIVRDITERKQAETALLESSIQFRTLFEASPDAILLVDPRDNWPILDCNTAACQMNGYTRDELIGQPIDLLNAKPLPSVTLDEYLASIRQAGVLRYETLHRRKDGTEFSIEVSTSLISLGGRDVLLGIDRDITERRQAEEKVRKSEEKYRYLFENNPHPMWIYDRKTLAFLNVNEAAVAKYGFTRQEFLNMTLVDIRPPEDVERLMKNLAQPRQPLEYSEGWRHRLKDGTIIQVEITSHTIEVDGHESALVVAQDITERRQAEEEIRRLNEELELKIQERTAALSQANNLLQALMDHMPDHIYFKDAQCRFIRNSRSQANSLGLRDPAQVVGKTDFDFFPHAAKAYAEEQEVMRAGKPLVDFEEWVVWPDGQETWVSTTKVPLRNSEGQTIGIFGISRDITERKRTEQAIRQLNTDLKQQAAELQAANKELEAFSYSVSHDLRAPLRAIDGYTRILAEDYEPILDVEGKRLCGIISKEARRMGQLIDDLLAFSRLGRKELHSSKIDMKALAVSVFNELIKEEERERIDFQITMLPPTKADASLIRQVWANLLSNALKFTSRKERAVIEVGSQQSKAENIYYVRDTGAGFDMEYANKLFGVFQRLHGESEFEGTGVGLAIVQRVLRRHGGRVWAEGEVGKGAVFYFALPRKENQHE